MSVSQYKNGAHYPAIVDGDQVIVVYGDGIFCSAHGAALHPEELQWIGSEIDDTAWTPVVTDCDIVQRRSVDVDALFKEVMELIPENMVSSQEYLNDVIYQAASNNFDGWLLMLRSFVQGLMVSSTKVCQLSGKPDLVTRFLLSNAPLRPEIFTKNSQGKKR